jgi:hypothetical protein
MRDPKPDVLSADSYLIMANGFKVHKAISWSTVQAARIPRGHEIVLFLYAVYNGGVGAKPPAAQLQLA